VRALAKGVCIFDNTYLMHLGLMHRVNPPELPMGTRPFWDFLARPVGIFLEAGGQWYYGHSRTRLGAEN